MSHYWVCAGAFVRLYVPILGSYQSNRLDGPRMRMFTCIRKRNQSMTFNQWMEYAVNNHGFTEPAAAHQWDLFIGGVRDYRLHDATIVLIERGAIV